jgi:hypothetical protein
MQSTKETETQKERFLSQIHHLIYQFMHAFIPTMTSLMGCLRL